MDPDVRRWEARAAPEVVGEMRREVVEHVRERGVQQPPIQDLAVAVSEAVTNAVLHAFRDGTAGRVVVECEVTPETDRVQVVVRDDGIGMTPRADSPGLGLGMPLMAQLADGLEVRASEQTGGTEVRLTFAVPVYD